ncbi:MAG TPA: S4 domain-containing protein [Steroidobacteraceae bacterium]|nr:S4 domain-containing protein [Steroidobacteraceae bacterium]
MRERIQKVLAARGVGSRRQVEAWIAAGRITVNGKPAAPGQPIGERDDVRLDNRRLRLGRGAGLAHAAVAYHRPAQEGVRTDARGDEPSSIERLPKVGGRRWIPVSPLPPRDGGLEVFVTDGGLAAALTRRAAAIPGGYSVRVRGAFDESAIEKELQSKSSEAGLKGQITSVTASGGEASNRWLQVEVTGLRPRDLREVFEACGLEANRILRTRYGPIAMDRALARGRSRPLTEDELNLLQEAASQGAPGSRSTRR